MGLLTAKLPDGDHAQLRAIAEQRGVSMAEIIRQWIKQAPQQGIAPTNVHAACDRRIAELEAELRRLRGGVSTSTVDVSTAIAAEGTRPAFLAAPDDDCGLCGHGWHGDGTLNRVCGACGCDHYIAASEPLF